MLVDIAAITLMVMMLAAWGSDVYTYRRVTSVASYMLPAAMLAEGYSIELALVYFFGFQGMAELCESCEGDEDDS